MVLARLLTYRAYLYVPLAVFILPIIDLYRLCVLKYSDAALGLLSAHAGLDDWS